MADAGDAAPSTRAQDAVWNLAGAVGAGIGVLGFVTVFGGAILWIRANEAGLSANEVVAVVPKGVLVTTGASVLVPVVLLALLVVIVIAAVHMAFSIPAKMKSTKQRRDAHQKRRFADESKEAAKKASSQAQEARDIADNLRQIAARLHDSADPKAEELGKEADSRAETAVALETAARAAQNQSDKAVADAQTTAARLAQAEETPLWLDRAEWWVERVAIFLVLAATPLLAYGNPFDFGGLRPVILILVAVAAALLSLAVYFETDRILWFGVAAFFSVGIYTGLATYYRTTDTLKLLPAAALRAEHSPIAGFFLADTEKNLYLGSFRYASHPPRLMVIPRSQITDLTIGPSLATAVARKRAFQLAKLECHSLVSTAKGGAAAHACSKQQELTLQREATSP